ncbi:efflux RND transporter periplasmic adaptor subunit [Cupriavidus metallidurans]|uniref:efflux RND transporter periplasmic adaptor subunit n=1 Tax=Cupriavidus metallidurans TaxID=119219 RepID=UPI0035C7649E
MNSTRIWILGLVCLLATSVAAQPDEHADEDEHNEESAIVMSMQDRTAQGIRTERVSTRVLTDVIRAPGEVRLNDYQSVQVTPRITAQIVERHARLGDQVEAGKPLVTLSSVEMAAAQGALIEADREWQRVRKLGRGVVSETRYIAAEVGYQRTYATVRAYGLTEAQVSQLLSDSDASRATGEFALLSPRAGTVIRDPFVAGELVEPGRVLFEISDESVLWVEAQLRPDRASEVSVGSPAKVSRDGEHWLEGRIIQLRHQLDEATRTRGVRIEVPNVGHALHAGDYVDVALETADAQPRIAVPEEAVLLMQGAPTVFKVEAEELHPQPVQPGEVRGGWTEILAGLAEGDEIVTRGAFLLKSLALKSEMGEGHAH